MPASPKAKRPNPLALALRQAPPPVDAAALLLDAGLESLVLAQVLLTQPAAPCLIITDTLAHAEALAAELRPVLALLGLPMPVQFFPELEAGRRHLTPETESERARLLHQLGQEPAPLVVASLLAAISPLPPPATFQANELILRPGMSDWPPQKLAKYLAELDYDNEAEVHVPGEFSWRGGILDVFSPAHEQAVRLDYFGDTLEAMRFFEPGTQRSTGPAELCRVIPRGESALLDGQSEALLVDYLSHQSPTRLCLVHPEALGQHLAEYGDEDSRQRWRRLQDGPWPRLLLIERDQGVDWPAEQLWHCPYFALAPQFQAMQPELEEGWERLRHQLLRSHLQRWAEDGYQFLAACAGAGKLERFQAELAAEPALASIKPLLVAAPLASGAFFPASKLVLLSEFEIFGKLRELAPRRKGWTFHADHLDDGRLPELQPGDFAVHAAHGICKYQGVRQETVSDQVREVMVLEFAEDAKVFVPLDQAALVSRYVGTGKEMPTLSKLGGQRWKQLRHEAELATRDLAAELLRLQAMRASGQGVALRADVQQLRDFADAFPYNATPDQERAANEVRDDLARPRPMDRLLCGDVGFGKTEVAMRAAFQAVFCGKQVAVLVPTTVLCEQHFLSFRERFKEYPILIESLSRFRSPRQQQEVIAALADGKVDIVIGTHRLLSGDLKFKALGLLVVDEEQRFGVLHKERIKTLRAEVDVLTMTATPVPRTLYLSMSGLRDMSTIMTAPLARLPVQTVVAQYEEELIRTAIRREVQRGGQVFYLHNRVASIEQVCGKLRELVPDASFDIGHGQMAEHELETAFVRFLSGQTQVLVCTTIIESGLDIPNANTIIIDRADRFGLAELYQLRGRVGRYHRQAYAYLLIPKHAPLDNTARERLGAIRKYTQLGSGFRLAMRDLQIRGAGNLLGREQSGHINAVGFDLYCKLLQDAVAAMKRQAPRRRVEVALHLEFVAQGLTDDATRLATGLPSTYITDETLRLEAYRRVGGATTMAEVTELEADWRDRFGPVPPPGLHLLQMARVRLLTAGAGFHGLTVRDSKVLLEGPRGLYQLPGGRFPRLQRRRPAERLAELLALLEALPSRPPGTGAAR